MSMTVCLLLIATIALASQSAAQSCPRILDVCLILDASQSTCITDPNYKKGDTTCVNWKAMLNFAQAIVDNMYIGDSLTRVGCVVFATKASRKWNLTRYMDQSSLDTQIQTLEFTAGTTNTSGALDTMMSLVFNSSFGDRPDVPDVAIIVTSSIATDPSSVQAAIDRVQAAGVTTYAIGITSAINQTSLAQLASPPKLINQTYFYVPTYSGLSQIATAVNYQICYSGTTCN